MPPLTQLPRRRLTDETVYRPWVKAQVELGGPSLFWLPVSGFPLTYAESDWAQNFLMLLGGRLEEKFGLRTELFLRFQDVSPELAVDLRTYMSKRPRVFGLGRRSDADLPAEPTEEERREIQQRLKSGEFPGAVGQDSLWFVNKEPDIQRGLFFGHGHTTSVFLSPDPKTKAPPLPLTPALRAVFPVFQERDVDGEIAAQYALKDAFLPQSKKLFGIGLTGRPEYPSLGYILPWLESQNFLNADPDLRKRWFAFADVYVEESVKDKGLLLAIKEEKYVPILRDVLDKMADRKMVYPEAIR